MVAALLALALAPAPAVLPPCRATPVSWAAIGAAAETMVRPATTPGLRLARLVRPGPGCSSVALDAVYRGPRGAYLRLVQGGPRCCGEGGGPAPVARPAVAGWATALYRYGEGPHRDEGGWTLYLRRPGVEVALLSSRVTRADLLRVARSLAPAAAAPRDA